MIATTSSDEKAELAREAGADETIGYDGVRRARAGADRRRAASRSPTTASARATFEGSLAALRRRGMLVLYGQASGPVPPVRPERAARRVAVPDPPALPDYTATREELLARAGEVLGWVADGRLDVRIGGRYPLAEARRAHEDLEARRTTGKLLLDPRA